MHISTANAGDVFITASYGYAADAAAYEYDCFHLENTVLY